VLPQRRAESLLVPPSGGSLEIGNYLIERAS